MALPHMWVEFTASVLRCALYREYIRECVESSDHYRNWIELNCNSLNVKKDVGRV